VPFLVSYLERVRGCLRLCGKDYEAVVVEYDSFGESAFTITLKERKNKADG
jgi:hypothetical protein